MYQQQQKQPFCALTLYLNPTGNKSYTGKWMAKTQQIENPKPYDKGDFQMVLSFIMIKPYKPQPNVDGMKPIAQAIPQVQQPQAVKPEESFDDDLPPF
jgi:hypothetical protein